MAFAADCYAQQLNCVTMQTSELKPLKSGTIATLTIKCKKKRSSESGSWNRWRVHLCQHPLQTFAVKPYSKLLLRAL